MDSAGTWGPAFPRVVAIEGSSGDEVPATLEYAWPTAGMVPAWQAIALSTPGSATSSFMFEPSIAGMPLGTHVLAIRSVDSSGSVGVPFMMPLAVVPDSLTGHPATAETLVVYASNADGVIAGSRMEIPLGSNPQPHHSLHLPLGGAATGPAEVGVYLTCETGETSPLANALFTIVAEGTNGYDEWTNSGERFIAAELEDPMTSGMKEDPDKDGITDNGDGSDSIHVAPTATIAAGRNTVFLRLMIDLL